MEEILHQLTWYPYPIIYRVSYMLGGDRRISEPSTVAHPGLHPANLEGQVAMAPMKLMRCGVRCFSVFHNIHTGAW